MTEAELQRLFGWLGKALEGEDLISLDELFNGISAGEFQLFAYPKGCVVTKVTNHFGRPRLLVFLLAGEALDEWKAQANADLETFARQLGIAVIDAYARPGLEKSLKDLGWKREQVVLRMRLA